MLSWKLPLGALQGHQHYGWSSANVLKVGSRQQALTCCLIRSTFAHEQAGKDKTSLRKKCQPQNKSTATAQLSESENHTDGKEYHTALGN